MVPSDPPFDQSPFDQSAFTAGGIEPFDFELARPGQFPGVHYLAPEPAASFVAITERIQRRWPSCQPYRGAYDSVAGPAGQDRGQRAVAARADEARLANQVQVRVGRALRLNPHFGRTSW